MSLTKKEIVQYLNNPDAAELFCQADQVRQQYCGKEVHLRGIIEFSNACHRDCCYCGLRKSNQNLPRYWMTPDEIFETAMLAKELQYKTIVLQSGEDHHRDVEKLAAIVSRIKAKLDCSITLCVGELGYDDYARLREAGADRYLLKFETSNRRLFESIKPDSSYDKRMRCLSWIKKLGYQVGSGIMVGLPGQTPDILADDIDLMNQLDLDMIGIGPFIPHSETPFQNAQGGDLETTLKVIALARIVTRNAHIPATTAVGSINPQGRQKALQCGANVIMPNMTPKKYRKYYEIYPNKICVNEDSSDCQTCVELMVHSLGRIPAKDHGHSLKRKKQFTG